MKYFILALLVLVALATTISAHWEKGYDFKLVTENGSKLTSGSLGKYQKIGHVFTPTMDKAQTVSHSQYVRFDYAFGDYVESVKDCYATMANKPKEKIALTNLSYYKNDGNYTVTFERDQTNFPALLNLTKPSSATTVWCSVKFKTFPITDNAAYMGGCLSVDLATAVNITTAGAGHGYTAYGVRHSYDMRNCLPFNKADVNNAAGKNVFGDIFDYKTTTVVVAEVASITKAQCDETLEKMTTLLVDNMKAYVKNNTQTEAVVNVLAASCHIATDKFDLLADATDHTARIELQVQAKDGVTDLTTPVSAYTKLAAQQANAAGMSTTQTTAAQIVPPSCGDGKTNGDETDKDCGGVTCNARCAAGKNCLTDADCKSNVCKSNKCDGNGYSISAASPLAISAALVVAILVALVNIF